MSRRQIPLKSQYPTLLSELSVWVRRLAHIALIFGASVLVANALVGENGLVDSLEERHRHQVIVNDLARTMPMAERCTVPVRPECGLDRTYFIWCRNIHNI